MKFGAIDIGTNAARLLVGEVIQNDDNSSFVQKVSYTRLPLRLGENVFESGEIGPKKAIDFVKTVQAFKLVSEIFEVEHLRACATSAMREASNGDDVRQLILDATGVNIEIISGDDEAELIFSTFALLNIDDSTPYIVVDVGGGSTEVSVFENGERVASRSFLIGTLRILKEKIDQNIWAEIHDWLSTHVNLKEVHQIYATGGNINKTHKILGAKNLEPISFDAIQELRDELASLSFAARIHRYQLRPDRADVIVPALDIYLYILKTLKCTEIIVPKIGLADGMVYNMYLHHTT